METQLQPGKSNIDNPPKTLCTVCKSEINSGAKKCIHCNSFLDWRRFLHFNTIVISLLVALISVISATAPVLKSILTPQADTRFALFSIRGDKVNVLATNTGQRAAVLKEAWIEMKEAGSGKTRRVLLSKTDDKGKELIFEPDKWKNLVLSPVELHDAINLIHPEDYTSCRLFFVTFDLDHKLHEFTVDFSCKKFSQGED